jgi:hypothetical protein
MLLLLQRVVVILLVRLGFSERSSQTSDMRRQTSDFFCSCAALEFDSKTFFILILICILIYTRLLSIHRKSSKRAFPKLLFHDSFYFPIFQRVKIMTISSKGRLQMSDVRLQIFLQLRCNIKFQVPSSESFTRRQEVRRPLPEVPSSTIQNFR